MFKFITNRLNAGHAVPMPINEEREPKTKAKQSSQGSQIMYQTWWELYLSRHVYACLSSLGRLSRTPFATIMTIAVIGISLALPMGLFLVLKNIQLLTHNWDSSSQIALFLDLDVTEAQTDELLVKLQANPDIAEVNYISPQQGLAKFEKQSGLGDLIGSLPDNPLPGVIEVKPMVGVQSPAIVERLLENLKNYPHVSLAQLDLEWLQRLNGMIDVAKRAQIALAILLGLGVILVVGNTIRLATQQYQDELAIIKLVGATNAFVRRPFLYTGFFYGALGGIIAWLCIDFIIVGLQGPVDQLFNLYHSSVVMQELSFGSVLVLMAIGSMLGVAGSYLAVTQHLRHMDLELCEN